MELPNTFYLQNTIDSTCLNLEKFELWYFIEKSLNKKHFLNTNRF